MKAHNGKDVILDMLGTQMSHITAPKEQQGFTLEKWLCG